jgi:hypothetical protein
MTELFYTLGCIFFITTISAQCIMMYTWYQFHVGFDNWLDDDK